MIQKLMPKRTVSHTIGVLTQDSSLAYLLKIFTLYSYYIIFNLEYDMNILNKI